MRNRLHSILVIGPMILFAMEKGSGVTPTPAPPTFTTPRTAPPTPAGSGSNTPTPATDPQPDPAATPQPDPSAAPAAAPSASPATAPDPRESAPDEGTLTIHGTILDVQSSTVVGQAEVLIPELEIETFSDHEGKFILKRVPPRSKPYEVMIVRPGYENGFFELETDSKTVEYRIRRKGF